MKRINLLVLLTFMALSWSISTSATDTNPSTKKNRIALRSKRNLPKINKAKMAKLKRLIKKKKSINLRRTKRDSKKSTAFNKKRSKRRKRLAVLRRAKDILKKK